MSLASFFRPTPTGPQPAEDAVPSGARWLACHTTTCAHLQVPHLVQPDGRWVCTGCNTPKEA